MSPPELHAVASDPDDDWIRTLAELTNGEKWKLADALLERYSLDEFPESRGAAAHTGLHVALRQDELKLARRFGIIATAGHLRQVRATAIAWPREDRSSRASFDVHQRMRGEGRQAEMKKRLRQADREGMALSRRMLARLRADENPMPARQYEERLRRAIAAAVRREMLAGIVTKSDDWWMASQITTASRDVAVRQLRALADAVEKGPSNGGE
jgi:hypothetical protein